MKKHGSEFSLSVLDLCPILAGGTAADALRRSLDLARHTENSVSTVFRWPSIKHSSATRWEHLENSGGFRRDHASQPQSVRYC